MAKIIDCNCAHIGQDKLHGKNKRVANETMGKTPDKQVEVRCSVCWAKKTVSRD